MSCRERTGMTIDNILVSGPLAAYHASRPAENKSE
jgi:hypothetical protein